VKAANQLNFAIRVCSLSLLLFLFSAKPVRLVCPNWFSGASVSLYETGTLRFCH
jgi:hypothetical protein